MALDLDELETLVQAMTPGEWSCQPDWTCRTEFILQASPHIVAHVDCPVVDNQPNAAGIVALVTAAPELLRMARRCAGAEQELELCQNSHGLCDRCGEALLGDELEPLLAAARAEIERLIELVVTHGGNPWVGCRVPG